MAQEQLSVPASGKVIDRKPGTETGALDTFTNGEDEVVDVVAVAVVVAVVVVVVVVVVVGNKALAVERD